MISVSDILDLGWALHGEECGKTFTKNGFYLEPREKQKILITKGFTSYNRLPLNVVFFGYLHNQEDLLMLEHMIGSK